MNGRFSRAIQLWRHFGPRWLLYRAWYAFRLRSGLAQRSQPVSTWADLPLASFLQDARLSNPDLYLVYRQTQAPLFFFDPANREAYRPYLTQWDTESVSPVILAEEMSRGRLRYFQHTAASISFPPAWHTNPFTRQNAPSAGHWSRISDFAYGDIKIIWEASRFGFVYALVRAYWRSGDERYAELFWQAVMDWRAENPPMQGVNWKCGQETSLRVMAWCFGLYGFGDSAATTPERMAALVQMIAVSGERIEANLDYALSQRNNHGISEGMGLWTIGALFPEFQKAAHWRETGREVLEKQGRELIYEDGSFSQHSVNYHRLMLHDYGWCLRLGEVQKRPFSPELRERVALSGNWLYQIQAGEDGQVPYYGQNDGALILPLNNCDYQDFRPVIQSIHFLSTETRCYDAGPWDEDLLWLFGPESLHGPVKRPFQTNFQADVGGYHTLRTPESMLFTRCGQFRDRPSQADMLHVDLWWRGQPVAIDAGTYRYNAPPPWDNPLARTSYHNTVTVDGVDQMERAGRFLWLPWLRGEVQANRTSTAGYFAYWQGSHDGYGRLPAPAAYQRGVIRIGSDTWLVLDRLQSQETHAYRLHWLLADWPYSWDEEMFRLSLQTPAGAYYLQLGAVPGTAVPSLIYADAESPAGWHAPYYGVRKTAVSLALHTQALQSLFWTLFSSRPIDPVVDKNLIVLHNTEGKIEIQLQNAAHKLIVKEIHKEAGDTDSLVIIS